jgi:hypothetical protein
VLYKQLIEEVDKPQADSEENIERSAQCPEKLLDNIISMLEQSVHMLNTINETLGISEVQNPTPEVVGHPSCYNRPAFVNNIYSVEFHGKWYKFNQTRDCPHWLPGGNAYTRKRCDSAGVKTFPWSACNGCWWKR